MHANHLDIELAAADWLARRDGETWTSTAQAELERWLAQATAHRVAFLRLEAAWKETARLRALHPGDLARTAPAADPPPTVDRREQMLAALAHRPVAPRHRRRSRMAFAAAAVLAACAIALLPFRPAPEPAAPLSYQTALGEVRSLPLADGSQVTLGSDSRIEVRLSSSARDIALTRGEAIFAVAKDPQRPFSVTAGGYRAVAIGTRYGVRHDNGNLRVVVTEGTVRLESPVRVGNPAPSVRLPAGSVALARRSGVLVRSLPLARAQQLLDWPQGLLVFDDVSLNTAVAEFNRYNVRKLVVADAATGALRIGGTFRWNNVDGFTRLLQAGFPVRVETRDDSIVLHAR